MRTNDVRVIKTSEPIVITLKQNGNHVEIYLASKKNLWEGEKLYATIKHVPLNELDINYIRRWVEETYYEWDYDIQEPAMLGSHEFMKESKSSTQMNRLKSLKESILNETDNVSDIFNQGRQQQYDLGDLLLTIIADIGNIENEFLNIDEYTSKDLIRAFKDAYKDMPNIKVLGTYYKGGLR